jgi:DNA-binding MarR family transcriptional regulator
VRDVADERRVHITLTAVGRKLKAKAAAVPAGVLGAANCSLSEVVSLTRQIQALRKNLF